MSTPEIPQVPTNPTNTPGPQHPDQERKIGDSPKTREVTSSKKVDDLSRHESNHNQDPKQDPKHNAREKSLAPGKPGTGHPADEKPASGSKKQQS